MKIVVIGAGPSGYTCAIALAQKGAEVTIIESNHIGGVCLNVGCIPTKSLLHMTKSIGDAEIDWKTVLQHKDVIVTNIRGGVEALLKMNNVVILKGHAKFISSNNIVVNGQELSFDKAVIATGSSAIIPSFVRNSKNCLDSTQALALEKLPKSICIIGGGVVGCEMATVFNNAGVKVTIIEALEDILVGFEKKHVVFLKKHMKESGIDIHVLAKVSEVRDSGFSTTVAYEENGESKSCPCDKVLVSVGREANIDGLGLEKAGVTTENNLIVTDENFKTSADNIFAIGDCSSSIKLAYWGSTQAKKLAKHIINGNVCSMPDTIPSCVFTNPEIAKVGKSEIELCDRDIKCAEFPFAASGKALCIGEAEGYVKIIIDAGTKELLGGHIVGPMATELISILVPLITNHCNLDILNNSVFAHPTLSEAIAETVDMLNGESVNFKA